MYTSNHKPVALPSLEYILMHTIWDCAYATASHNRRGSGNIGVSKRQKAEETERERDRRADE